MMILGILLFWFKLLLRYFNSCIFRSFEIRTQELNWKFILPNWGSFYQLMVILPIEVSFTNWWLFSQLRDFVYIDLVYNYDLCICHIVTQYWSHGHSVLVTLSFSIGHIVILSILIGHALLLIAVMLAVLCCWNTNLNRNLVFLLVLKLWPKLVVTYIIVLQFTIKGQKGQILT